MKFVDPFDTLTRVVTYGGDPADWTNGSPGLLDGSVPPAQALTHPMQEIVNAIIAAGLTPSSADLTQLAQAMAAVAGGAAATRARLIATPTVISVPGDFATLQAAIDSVADALVAPDATVTFALGAGVHTITSDVVIDHVHAARFWIVGAALPGAFPVDTDVTSSISASRTALRAKMSTILSVQGCNGIVVKRGGLGLLQDVMIDHNGAGGGVLGCLVVEEGHATVDRCVMFGADLAAAGDGSAGVLATIAGNVTLTSSLIAHCDTGIVSQNNSLVRAFGAASPLMPIMRCRIGVAAYVGGLARVRGCRIAGNSETGILCGPGGTITLDEIASTWSGNAENITTTGGRIDASLPSFGAPTGTYSLRAATGGYINFAGASGDTTSTPALNTVGNNNAYIRSA